MRYKVPQFIEIEDKVVGPFTIRQFVYLVGGGALCYLWYILFPFFISGALILLTGGFSLALTFYRVNGKPFIDIVQAYLSFITGGKLYVWQKREKKASMVKKETKGESTGVETLPKLSSSRLKDLSWSLDVLDVNKR